MDSEALDPFTKQILARTRARQEDLMKDNKERSGQAQKRRNVLSEDTGFRKEDRNSSDAFGHESPKRRCSVSPNLKPAFYSEDEKENAVMHESSNLRNQNNAHVIGALRKNITDAESKLHVTKATAEVHCPVTSSASDSSKSSSLSSTSRFKGRLANLAANINNWEDDATYHFPSARFGDKPTTTTTSRQQSRNPKTAAYAQNSSSSSSQSSLSSASSSTSSISQRDAELESNASADSLIASKMHDSSSSDSSACLEKGASDGGNASQDSDSLGRMQANKAGRPSAMDTDSEGKNVSGGSSSSSQSSLNQQEAQGFTKSPSASKLMYQYSRPQSKVNEAAAKFNKAIEILQEGCVSAVKKNPKTQSSGDAPTSKSVGNGERKEIILNEKHSHEAKDGAKSQNTITETNSEKAGSNVTDPAFLPLSSRKALFEQKMGFSPVSGGAHVAEPETLSVSERAALFERSAKIAANGGVAKKWQQGSASVRSLTQAGPSAGHTAVGCLEKGPTGPLAGSTPISMPSPQKKVEAAVTMRTPTKSAPVDSANGGIKSPAAPSVGSSTRMVQEQLLKAVQSDWKAKETVSRSLEERKKEMLALRNRWEKASSGSGGMSGDKGPSVEETPADEEDEEPAADEYQDVGEESNQSGDADYDDEEEYEDELADDYDDDSNAANCDGNDVDTDEQQENMDDFVDEAFGDIEGYADPVLSPPHLSNEMIVMRSPAKNPVSPPPQVVGESSPTKGKGLYPSLDEFKDPQPSSQPAKQTPDNKKEVPLMHTISMYRKQKQALSLTPVKKTVVRKEQVTPKSSSVHAQSPGSMRHLAQERIRELQQEAEAQQVVISQASQALNLCLATAEFHGSKEQLECEKLLLIASQKKQAVLNEVERLKTEGGLGNTEDICTGVGTMTLSDITLPLKIAFMEAKLTGEIGNDVHYFIVVIRHKAQVVSTQMMSTEDECVKAGVLSFSNLITIHDLKDSFEVSLDVYALQTAKEKVLGHKKLAKKGSGSLRGAKNKKRGSKNLFSPGINSPASPFPSTSVQSSSFGLVGSLKLTLQNCNRTTFNLEKVPYTSPLEGTIRLRVQIRTVNSVHHKGFLTMFEDVSGYGSWFRRWCVLTGNELIYWKYPDDEKTKAPIGSIDLKQCVTPQVGLVPRDICARPNTLYLLNFIPTEKNANTKETLISRNHKSFVSIRHYLSADTLEERKEWCRKLNEALQHLRLWEPTALRPLEPAELEQYMQSLL